MRILVTGGAGYIGSFTTRALQESGHTVVLYDNLRFGHPQAVRAEIIEADLADMTALDRAFAGGDFEAVIHFAAWIEAGESMKDAARFFTNNTANAINLLNASVKHGIKQLVFSSTAGLYGNPVRLPIKESDPTVPTNVYAETKLLVERMLPWYQQVYGLRSVSLRYFNASGAAIDGTMGQDHSPASHIISIAIEAALGQREFFPLYGEDYDTPDGTCIRDYIHVLDLASAHVLALDYLIAGGNFDVFNVGTGHGYSNREVIETVKRVSGVDFPVRSSPRRTGDPGALVADASKLRDRLGWKPEYSDLETIISTAWEWHHTHPHGYRD